MVLNYLDAEERSLAPYSLKSALTRGRRFDETEHAFRSPYQRDRDRIIHCKAFRRLEYKTQVFVYHEGDHYRTRLTHTIEVAQISRTIARALGLNEDAAEAIALAHDLGHPPFGHVGEETLNELMSGYGGFEHNAHSLRIVEELERRYPGFSGLNLTWEVREGIIKHSSEHDRPGLTKEYDVGIFPCLEAQIVDLADEIAYNNHDIDDGLSSMMLDPEALDEVELWRESCKEARDKSPDADFKIIKCQTIIGIINRQVTDLVSRLEESIKREDIGSLQDVRKAPVRLASFSPEMERMNGELKAFLRTNLYNHYRVLRMADKARRIIENLFEIYIKNPRILPPDQFRMMEKTGKERAICDHIAGMTDRFALDEYKKLMDPYEKV